MLNFYKFLFCAFLILISGLTEVLAQGIRGKVSSEKGEALPFASIYIRNTGDGTTSNSSGQYEIKTGKGLFDLVIQYMGYESVLKTIQVGEDWLVMDFSLKEQIYALQEVTINSKSEDPALTIMRRAISKARFHRLQVQEYQMSVYMKGTGKLTNVPFLLKKQLEKDGVKVNDAYTSESVSKIKFSLPNKVEEKVISIRTSGDNHNISPTAYVATSFYNDKINEIISPLSRSAFAYYKFTFLGSFYEQGLMVNKIKVTPRAKGEGLCEGYIYIIDELWAIHSLDLKTTLLGINMAVKQQYAPVHENVWMPIQHTYSFSGKFLGLAGEYNYLASIKDYQIVLNPDLITKVNIIDDKVEALPENIASFSKKSSAKTQINEAETMEKKDYKKMVKAYETELKRENNAEQIISERTYAIDSLAKKRGLSYWDSIRPYQLTLEEIKGYAREDSVYTIEQAKYSTDSSSKAVLKKFNAADLLLGGKYFFGKGKSIQLAPNLSNFAFNTVEGFKFGFSGTFTKENKEKLPQFEQEKIQRFSFTPEVRYGFSSNRLYYKFNFNFFQRELDKSYQFGLNAGSFIEQFNTDEPISEWVNSAYSLYAKLNYAKFFEHNFAEVYANRRISPALNLKTSVSYAQRRHLENNSNFSRFYRGTREYSPNLPVNNEAAIDIFQNHSALIWSSQIDFRPGLKYVIRNGVKRPIYNSAPLVQLMYKKAIPNLLGGAEAASFDQIELGLKDNLSVGLGGKLDYNLRVGNFFSNDRLGFMDFQHFGGNRTIFSNMGVVSNYRFLDYYSHSTQSWYFSSIVHYRFKKFLFTRIPTLSYSGLRESIFLNVLKTGTSPYYSELGYSFDNLFRFFRLETGVVLEGDQFKYGGFRVGVASFFR